MAKTYTGVVSASNRRIKGQREISVALDRDTPAPRVGDRVTVTVVLTDEEIGRRLREMLTKDVDRRSVRSLAEEISDSAGWPVLSDLILSLIDGKEEEGR